MKLTTLLFTILCISCAGNANAPLGYTESNLYNFSKHNGKTVKSMYYEEESHSSYNHTVHIKFTDGTEVQIAAYKYRQHIY